MTTFSLYLLVAGGLAVGAGWVLLLHTISRALRRRRLARSRVLPARRPADAFAAGRVSLPRAAGTWRPARGPAVAVLPGIWAATAVFPASSRLNGALGDAHRRAVAGVGEGWAPATNQLPARPKEMQNLHEIRRAGQ